MMDPEEVLAKIKSTGSDLYDNKLMQFYNSLDEICNPSSTVKYLDNPSMIENSCLNFLEVKHNNIQKLLLEGCLRDLYNQIQLSCKKRLDAGQKVAEKNFQVLNNKRAEVTHLEEVLEKLKTEHEIKQIKVAKLQKQCEQYHEKMKRLQQLKLCIKTYKLLTRTHFVYKKGRTMGYIKGKNPLNFEVFDFDHSEVSQEDITKKLWALLENVAREDSTNNKN